MSSGGRFPRPATLTSRREFFKIEPSDLRRLAFPYSNVPFTVTWIIREDFWISQLNVQRRLSCGELDNGTRKLATKLV